VPSYLVETYAAAPAVLESVAKARSVAEALACEGVAVSYRGRQLEGRER
jgi:hypothetical protein